MIRLRKQTEEIVNKVFYLCGLMDRENRKDSASSCFDVDSILARVDCVLISEELFKCSHLSINTLARKAGTNRTYLSRCFHIKKTSFVNYINEYRLRYAIRVIGESGNAKRGVAEISEMAGFPNPRSFAKCFVLKYGVNPSQYKREVLAKSTQHHF